MDSVRYVIPIVFGTVYLRFVKDVQCEYVRCNILDFNDNGNLFTTTIKEVRYKVFQKRYDVYCKQRMYRRDDPNYSIDINILVNLGFRNIDEA